jgi:hypothetical protein
MELGLLLPPFQVSEATTFQRSCKVEFVNRTKLIDYSSSNLDEKVLQRSGMRLEQGTLVKYQASLH